jgi:hypothetical protein
MIKEKVRRTGGVALALLGAIGASVQAGRLVTGGKAICLNEGCRIIEGLTRVPPLFVNIAGLGFFLVIAVLTWSASRSNFCRCLLGLLLLAGIAAEGVLFGYQDYVAKAFCTWCLGVFTLVVLLNLLNGWRHTLKATTVFAASLVAFSVLHFGVIQPPTGTRGLDTGTWGVHRCTTPGKELYLIFSSTCPHCAEVLRALKSCNTCSLHFNPIDQVGGSALPGVERLASYNPGVNRELLALLGIDEVPVLLVPSQEGLSVIRGKERILAFIRTECFRTPPVFKLTPPAPVFNLTPQPPVGNSSLSIPGKEEDDSCNINTECTTAGQTPH